MNMRIAPPLLPPLPPPLLSSPPTPPRPFRLLLPGFGAFDAGFAIPLDKAAVELDELGCVYAAIGDVDAALLHLLHHNTSGSATRPPPPSPSNPPRWRPFQT